jgi:hypothetical protein
MHNSNQRDLEALMSVSGVIMIGSVSASERMTNSASRKQARRFWGAMAAIRRTSRWLDTRRTDSVIRRDNGQIEERLAAAG